MTAQRALRRDVVRDAVIGRILNGTYPPGTKLKELAQAAAFGVSQARLPAETAAYRGISMPLELRETWLFGASCCSIAPARWSSHRYRDADRRVSPGMRRVSPRDKLEAPNVDRHPTGNPRLRAVRL